MIYIESPSADPRFNLALEQYIFEQKDRSQEYFMLWQNHNTIVVGRYQNTAMEVNREFVDANQTSVVRRLSGGGAVYHDMGNLNFTYIVDHRDLEHLSFEYFCRPVIQALAKIGVRAEANGRNDLVIDGRKFSGNAQYVRQGRVMHHGTLLFDSDLSVLARALRVSPGKMRAKGVASTRNRVANISSFLDHGISLQDFKSLLIEAVFQSLDVSNYALKEVDIARITEIQRGRYDRWEWNYGASPAYNIKKKRRFENCGEVMIYLNESDGMIRDLQIRGDFFGGGDLRDLSDRLIGKAVDRAALLKAMSDLNLDDYIRNLTVPGFVDMILE